MTVSHSPELIQKAAALQAKLNGNGGDSRGPDLSETLRQARDNWPGSAGESPPAPDLRPQPARSEPIQTAAPEAQPSSVQADRPERDSADAAISPSNPDRAVRDEPSPAIRQVIRAPAEASARVVLVSDPGNLPDQDNGETRTEPAEEEPQVVMPAAGGGAGQAPPSGPNPLTTQGPDSGDEEPESVNAAAPAGANTAPSDPPSVHSGPEGSGSLNRTADLTGDSTAEAEVAPISVQEEPPLDLTQPVAVTGSREELEALAGRIASSLRVGGEETTSVTFNGQQRDLVELERFLTAANVTRQGKPVIVPGGGVTVTLSAPPPAPQESDVIATGAATDAAAEPSGGGTASAPAAESIPGVAATQPSGDREQTPSPEPARESAEELEIQRRNQVLIGALGNPSQPLATPEQTFDAMVKALPEDMSPDNRDIAVERLASLKNRVLFFTNYVSRLDGQLLYLLDPVTRGAILEGLPEQDRIQAEQRRQTYIDALPASQQASEGAGGEPADTSPSAVAPNEAESEVGTSPSPRTPEQILEDFRRAADQRRAAFHERLTLGTADNLLAILNDNSELSEEQREDIGWRVANSLYGINISVDQLVPRLGQINDEAERAALRDIFFTTIIDHEDQARLAQSRTNSDFSTFEDRLRAQRQELLNQAMEAARQYPQSEDQEEQGLMILDLLADGHATPEDLRDTLAAIGDQNAADVIYDDFYREIRDNSDPNTPWVRRWMSNPDYQAWLAEQAPQRGGRSILKPWTWFGGGQRQQSRPASPLTVPPPQVASEGSGDEAPVQPAPPAEGPPASATAEAEPAATAEEGEALINNTAEYVRNLLPVVESGSLNERQAQDLINSLQILRTTQGRRIDLEFSVADALSELPEDRRDAMGNFLLDAIISNIDAIDTRVGNGTINDVDRDSVDALLRIGGRLRLGTMIEDVSEVKDYIDSIEKKYLSGLI